MSQLKLNQVTDAEADYRWRWLYKVGGVTALLIPVMYLVTASIVLPAYRDPFPTNVTEWFTVFQNDWLTGLFFLGFADIVITIASGPMSLALYTALRRVNRTCMAIATPFAFVGIAVYLATNTAFAMLSLSSQYAAATSEAQRAVFLAAGQATLAVTEGTGGYTGMALVLVAGLIMSAVMLQSKSFGKVTAWVGILAFVLLLTTVPFGGYAEVTPRGPVLTAIIYASNYGGGLLSLVWYILVGLRLLQLGRLAGKSGPELMDQK